MILPSNQMIMRLSMQEKHKSQDWLYESQKRCQSIGWSTVRYEKALCPTTRDKYSADRQTCSHVEWVESLSMYKTWQYSTKWQCSSGAGAGMIITKHISSFEEVKQPLRRQNAWYALPSCHQNPFVFVLRLFTLPSRQSRSRWHCSARSTGWPYCTFKGSQGNMVDSRSINCWGWSYFSIDTQTSHQCQKFGRHRR